MKTAALIEALDVDVHAASCKLLLHLQVVEAVGCLPDHALR